MVGLLGTSDPSLPARFGYRKPVAELTGTHAPIVSCFCFFVFFPSSQICYFFKCVGITIRRRPFPDQRVLPSFSTVGGPLTPRVAEDMPEKLVRKREGNKYFASTFEGDSAEKKKPWSLGSFSPWSRHR